MALAETTDRLLHFRAVLDFPDRGQLVLHTVHVLDKQIARNLGFLLRG